MAKKKDTGTTRVIKVGVRFPDAPPIADRDHKTPAERAAEREFYAPLHIARKDLTRAANSLMTALWLLERGEIEHPVEPTDRLRGDRCVPAGTKKNKTTLAYQAFAQGQAWSPFDFKPELYRPTTKYRIGSAVLGMTARQVKQRLDTDLAGINSGEKSIATFKLVPIVWPAARVQIDESGCVSVPLWADADKQPRLRFQPVFGQDHGQRREWARVLDGTHKLGTVSLFQDKTTRRWTAAITFTQSQITTPATGRRMGIDTGISQFAQLAVVEADGTLVQARSKHQPPADFDRALNRLMVRKSAILASTGPAPGAKGRGRKRATRAATKMKDRYARLVASAVQTVAARCVRDAVRWGVSEIHMENLTGWSYADILRRTADLPGTSRRARRRFFGKWRHAALVEAVRNAAEKQNIGFYLVSARNTSKTCSNCGTVYKEDGGQHGRVTRDVFACTCHLPGKTDEFRVNADYNAAINIARRDPEIDSESSVPPLKAERPVARPEGEISHAAGQSVSTERKGSDVMSEATPQLSERSSTAQPAAISHARKRKSTRGGSTPQRVDADNPNEPVMARVLVAGAPCRPITQPSPCGVSR